MCLLFQYEKLTLEVWLLPQQVADGSLKLGVFPVAGVDVCLTVRPEEKKYYYQD